MAETTTAPQTTQSVFSWGGVDSFLKGITGASETLSDLKSSWDNFGKSDAEIKAEQDAKALALAQQTELQRIAYQQQVTATQTASNNTSSDNTKILLLGAGMLAIVFLMRGK